MKHYELFDILGPIMIGPSSSHTAGACKIGLMARRIYGKEIKRVKFYLHGSFAKTYKGHGTDKALLAGIMGFNTDDENIVISKEIAKKRNIEYEFIETSLGLVHPNTVKIEFIDENNNTFSITGSSIGGGKAKIIGINDIKLNFTGEFPTIILRYKDRKGVVLEASSLIYNANINIANLKINRLKGIATFILELDEPFNEMLLNQFKGLKDIDLCIGINSI